MAATSRGRGRGKPRPTHESLQRSVQEPIGASSSLSSSCSIAVNLPSQKLSSSLRDDDDYENDNNLSRPSVNNNTHNNNVIQLSPSSAPTKSQPHPMNTASSILLTTPLKTLKLIEATILLHLNNNKMTKRPISSDSTAMLSLDEWNLWVHAHEWSASATVQMDSRERTSKHDSSAVVPFPTTEWMSTLSNFTMSFSEEERLLFDLLLVSSNDDHVAAIDDGSSQQPSLYPLYRLVVNNHKLYLEVLSSLSSSPSYAKDGAAVKSRMEVLGERYHQCRTFLRLLHTSTDSNSHDNGNDSKEKEQCVQWCNHALKLAQMIHDYKINVTKPSQRSAPNKRNDSASSFVHSIVTNKGTSTDSVHEAHSNPDESTQKLSLEERIRARAKLRELHNARHKAKSTASRSGILHNNNNHEKKRALLELADALRYFSQRRGVSSRSQRGGSALERLQCRVVNDTSSADGGVERAVTARLSITDFLQDARLCWNGILRNCTGSGTAKGGGSAASGSGMSSSSSSSVVHVDLGRVLFHLRLDMTYDSTTNGNKSAAEEVDAMMVSDRRQMEKYLLNLLQELTTIVPNWISVSRIPATFSSIASTSSIKRKDPTFSSSYGTFANGAENTKSIITRDSLIVIRNDTVDYNTDVRAKLGGRTVSRPDTSSNGGRKRTIEGDRKEQQQEITTKLHGKKRTFGPSVVADAIVPPSFRQRYGKVIESACVKAATQKKK